MIVLDMHVVSEVLKPSPRRSLSVGSRLSIPGGLFITTITQVEVLYGLERLPAGKRKLNLSVEIERMFVEDFPDRSILFDEQAARLYAKIVQ